MESIMGYDERFCPRCGGEATQWHHLIFGYGKRELSEKYGLKIRYCGICHRNIHERDFEYQHWLKCEAQRAFEEHFPNEDFRAIFGRNYI